MPQRPERKPCTCKSIDECVVVKGGRPEGDAYCQEPNFVPPDGKIPYQRAPGRINWNPEGVPPPDPVTEAIRADMLQRQRIGWTRYGIGLGRADFTMRDWLHHLYEELLDAAQYTKRLMMTLDGTLPVEGDRENIEIKTELPAQEIARLTREIGLKQARIMQLVGGDPLKGVGIENTPPLSKAVYSSPICIFKYCPDRNQCEPSGTCVHPVQGHNSESSNSESTPQKNEPQSSTDAQ